MYVLTVVRAEDPEEVLYSGLYTKKAQAEAAAARYKDSPALAVSIDKQDDQ